MIRPGPPSYVEAPACEALAFALRELGVPASPGDGYTRLRADLDLIVTGGVAALVEQVIDGAGREALT